MNIPELLSPAGDENAFVAAIDAGANAVYFGIGNFNARVRAKNIDAKKLSFLVSLAHSHNVKTYLTLNILLHDDEIKEALELVKFANDCKVDAIIIQDLGLLNLISENFPKLELHASTQFTTHSIEQCNFLSLFNVKQINLSRELSIIELKPINDFLKTKKIVSEVFIHGAFCISYSGQCYLSGSLYNKCGNRGECVQPCRRLYSTSTNEYEKYKGTPFNLKDNNLYTLIDKLTACGVGSVKIEGRIKNANYVWAVTSAYREQLDKLASNEKLQMNCDKLSKSMNRNFTNGYAAGIIASSMFHFGKKDESVENVAIVKNYTADTKVLTFTCNDKVNNFPLLEDELTITTTDSKFICTAIVKKILSSTTCEILITNKLAGRIENNQIIQRAPQVIAKETLENKISNLKNSILNSEQNDKILLNVNVEICNNKLQCKFYELNTNKTVEVISEKELLIAQNQRLSEEVILEKFSKLGQTNYKINKISVDKKVSEFFLPLGELNAIRRKAIEQLCIYVPKLEKQIIIPELKYNKNNTIQISVLEIPNSITNIFDNLLQSIIDSQDVVPFFPAILFSKDMEQHLKLLHEVLKIKKELTIICDNSGFALEASKLNCKIILGPRLNIANSFTLQAYSKVLNVVGFIPSIELTDEQLNKIKMPENNSIYLLKNYNFPVMQSRQCLLKNMTHCEKEICNYECLEKCNKKIEFTGTNNEQLIAVKRPGFYSSLYLKK